MLEKDFSIEKLIKNLRDLKLAVKKEIMNDDMRLKIQHLPRNIIDLDLSDDSIEKQVEEQIATPERSSDVQDSQTYLQL